MDQSVYKEIIPDNDDIFDKIQNKFSIITPIFFFQNSNIYKYQQIDDIIGEIDTYARTTGIIFGTIDILNNNSVFVIVFDSIIIFFDQHFFIKFKHFFEKIQNNRTQILFYNDYSQSKFNELRSVELCYQEISSQLSKHEFFSFTKHLKDKIVLILIKKCQIRSRIRYNKSKYDKNINSINETNYNDDEFINIKQIKKPVFLYLNVKDQHLYAIKKFEITSSVNLNHEIVFYNEIKNVHPFISKYYGHIKRVDGDYIIIEYIEGETLLNFIQKNRKKLKYLQKMRILLEILIAIEYIHIKGIILRDIKYDNIMIDSNQDAILIDFDNTIKYKDNEDHIMTEDIGVSYFMSPEHYKSDDYSYQSDIYSVGMIIHFIATEMQFNFDVSKVMNILHETHTNILDCKEIAHCSNEFKKLENYYTFCLNYYPDDRPNISILLNYIFYLTQDNILQNRAFNDMGLIGKLIDVRKKQIFELKESGYTIEFLEVIDYFFRHVNNIYESPINCNILIYMTYINSYVNSDILMDCGLLFLNGTNVPKDISLAIYYLTLSANQSNSKAQYLLGSIYYYADYVPREINKSIYYLTLSAKQNNSDAQFILGSIYYYAQYVPRDIYKSLYYLTLSANQNNPDSQYLLGDIYFNGQFIPCDLKKSIHYLTLSANQNHNFSQYSLGRLYLDGKYVPYDIKKSISYLKKSATNFNSNALYYLGVIYLSDKYVPRDINQAINYLTFASNLKNPYAQMILGIYYYDKDINKVINYFSLASIEQPVANVMLGIIYYEGKYCKPDIKKSVLYFKNSTHTVFRNISYNNLGVIYKKGYDISKSIEYFEDSIRFNNDPYSLYNLARIYYFGIDTEKDIPKSINLLKRASNNNLIIAKLFLSSINQYNDKRIKFLLNFLNIRYDMHNFFRDYDLIYTFYAVGNPNDMNFINILEKHKNINTKIQIDINEHFYNGFYN